MNANFLKAKTAGLPRWAWVGLLSGAVLVGLYLRTRTPDETVEGAEIEDELPEGSLGQYDGTESAGGLAAAGLVGPAAGSVVPVQTPYLPEGLVDIFSELASIVREQGAYITERDNVRTEAGALVTGGGAPEAGGFHETPVPSPAPASSCSQGERNEISRLTGEIQSLNNQLEGVNNELARLNNAFAASNNKNQKDQIRAKITAEQSKRNQLQGSRDSKVAKRAPIQAKCR